MVQAPACRYLHADSCLLHACASSHLSGVRSQHTVGLGELGVIGLVGNWLFPECFLQASSKKCQTL